MKSYMSKIYALSLFALVISGSLSAQQPGCDLDGARKSIGDEKFRSALSQLQHCDDGGEASALRGSAYFNLYMPDSAIARLSIAEKKGIKDDEILVMLAQAYLWKKDFAQADTYLRRVSDQTRIDYRKVLAQRHEILGEYEKSLEILDQIVREDPDDHASRFEKAKVLSWTKEFDRSIALYTAIIENEKTANDLRIQARINRAEVLSWQKKFSKALEELDAVIETDKKNTRARLNKAQILEWQGKYKAAKNIYKDVLLIEPDDKQAQIRLEKLMWVK